MRFPPSRLVRPRTLGSCGLRHCGCTIGIVIAEPVLITRDHAAVLMRWLLEQGLLIGVFPSALKRSQTPPDETGVVAMGSGAQPTPQSGQHGQTRQQAGRSGGFGHNRDRHRGELRGTEYL